MGANVDNKKTFKVAYEILGGPNATDGAVTRRVRAFGERAVGNWVTAQAAGSDYSLLWIAEVEV